MAGKVSEDLGFPYGVQIFEFRLADGPPEASYLLKGFLLIPVPCRANIAVFGSLPVVPRIRAKIIQQRQIGPSQWPLLQLATPNERLVIAVVAIKVQGGINQVSHELQRLIVGIARKRFERHQAIE